MLKKIIISILALSVVGAGAAAAAYNFAKSDTVTPATTANESLVLVSDQEQFEQAGIVEPTPQADYSEPMTEGMSGEPFIATGIVTAVELNGVELATNTSETIFVELGPQDFLLEQGVELTMGDEISVTGMVEADMYHVTELTLRSTDEIITLRTEDGTPMWSGGASEDHGNTGSADGSHTPDPQTQVAADEWVTLSGTLVGMTRGRMTIQTADGTQISFQSGQPSFFASQGVTFNLGDTVSVVGYWGENDQFTAGDVTQTATGLKVMLRDPNGRPLWAGPGGNGNGNGNGGSNAQNAQYATTTP